MLGIEPRIFTGQVSTLPLNYRPSPIINIMITSMVVSEKEEGLSNSHEDRAKSSASLTTGAYGKRSLCHGSHRDSVCDPQGKKTD